MKDAISRRRFGIGLCAASTAVIAGAGMPSRAQDWPSRPIRIIESFPAGVARDPLTRVLADRLSKVLGQQVIVENRPGGAGRIAGAAAAQSAPDGYTFWMAGIGDLVTAKYLYKLPYDTDRDFVPVVMFLQAPTSLVVRQSLPVKSLAELISYAKQNPGELSYGSTGMGQFLHLNGLLFASMSGISLKHVPYAQGSPFNDLLGGHIDMVLDTLTPTLEDIKAGLLRALAVTGQHRLAVLPDVPTFAEAGLRGFDPQGGGGLLAPKGTPAPIVLRLQQAVDQVLEASDLHQRWEALGFALPGGTSADFSAWVRLQDSKWSKVIRDNNLRIE